MPAAYFSVGIAGDNKSSPSNSVLTISITDGIATFNFPQNNTYLGIGDKVLYDIDKIGYLGQKVNGYSWYINDKFGVAISNTVSPKIVSYISKVFNSLSLLDLYTLLGSYDLVSNNVQINLACYEMTDSSFLVINNLWTIDATRYIKIYTPYDVITQCNLSQRHKGIPYISGSITGYGYIHTAGIEILQTGIIIEGLQIMTTSVTIRIRNISGTVIRNNIITSIADNGILENESDDTGTNSYYISNFIYNCGAAGISVGTRDSLAISKNCFMYNNTVIGCYDGIKIINRYDGNNTYNIYLKNNLCYNNSHRDFNFNNH